MKPYFRFMLAGVALLAIAAVGNIYYETLPGLVIKHPITGVVTAHINGTNGTVTAGAFVGTNLPSTFLLGFQNSIVSTTVSSNVVALGGTNKVESDFTQSGSDPLLVITDNITGTTAPIFMSIDASGGPTDDTSIALMVGNEASANSSVQWLYSNEGSKAIYASVGGFSSGGSAMALSGAALSHATNQVGISAHADAKFDGQTNVAFAATAVNELNTTGATVGAFIETLDLFPPSSTWTKMESATLLLDNRDSGFPLIIARTNNGTTVFKVNYDGRILVPAGTATLPSLAVGTTSNGIYSAGANTVGFATSGTARWFIAADGTLGASVDNFLNIGAFGSSRPAVITAGQLSTASAIGFTGYGGYIRNSGSKVYSLETDGVSPNYSEFRGASGVGTDKNGGSIIIEGGQSTGTGRGGDVVFRTSITTNTSSAANFYSTRSYQSAKYVDLSDATTNLLFKCSLEPSTYCGGAAIITLFISNGTDFKVHTSNVSWSAVNKGGTITGMVVESAQLENHVETAGTAITDTYTFHQDGANNTFYIAVTPTQGTVITPSVYRAKWVITALNSNDPATITPP